MSRYPFSLSTSDYALLSIVVLAYAVIFTRQRYRHTQLSMGLQTNLVGNRTVPPAQANEKNVHDNRVSGEWTPVQFTYPKVTPLQEELNEMPQRSYRPFKAGIYHITMGIRNMEWDEWIELDNNFPAYHRLRTHRVATRGSKLVQVLPDRPGLVQGGAEAAKELVYELAEFLQRRYPNVYAVTRYPATGDGRIETITILPLGVTYHLEKEDPMTVSALLIQDDLAIMIEGKDGQYYLQAGAIIVPGSWRLEDKIGMPLDEIHISGEVPYYPQKLQLSLNRFFRRLTTTDPVTRDNWLIQMLDPAHRSTNETDDGLKDSEELAWNHTAYGPEDDYPHPPSSYALSLGSPPSRTASGPRPPGPPVTPQTLRLRTEHQTLRRLPRTGAIVFTIRTYMTSIEQLGKEPGVPGTLAGAVRGVTGEVRRRKRQENYEQILLNYLDECHSEQVAKGEA